MHCKRRTVRTHWWLRFALAVLGALCLAHPARGAETLRQAVERALQTNPEIAAEAARTRAAKEEVAQARGAYFPSVDLSAGVGRERGDTPNTRASGFGRDFVERQESSIVLTQRLFDGQATQSEVRRQEARFLAASHRLAETAENVALRSAGAFLLVLRDRELLQLARENVAIHVATRDKVALRVSAGVSQSADLQQAEARVALARSSLSTAEGRLRASEANYRRLLGVAPGELTAPSPTKGRLTRNGRVDEEALSNSIREAVRIADSENPALAAARAELAFSEATLEGTKAAYLPRIDLELGANRNRNIGGIPGPASTETAMLAMRWNLLRGGTNRAQERAAAERRYAAMDALNAVRREVEERIRVALSQKATSEERLGHLREHVLHTMEAATSYELQLEIGRRSLLDLLNAQNELFTARSNLVAGRYEDLLNGLSVEAAKGMLVRSLGLSVPDQV